jgi:hypothetical protein
MLLLDFISELSVKIKIFTFGHAVPTCEKTADNESIVVFVEGIPLPVQ